MERMPKMDCWGTRIRFRDRRGPCLPWRPCTKLYSAVARAGDPAIPDFNFDRPRTLIDKSVQILDLRNLEDQWDDPLVGRVPPP